ncbi:MAG TPA: hypothetical protein PL196_00035 [Burkholderiaceae bacterium]|nr:hypothetical protein [Burkholderiaceae bacterium]
MQIDLAHPALTPREREGIELLLSLHRIYRDQHRMRESYTAALGAIRLWHLWTRDSNQPDTISMGLKK